MSGTALGSGSTLYPRPEDIPVGWSQRSLSELDKRRGGRSLYYHHVSGLCQVARPEEQQFWPAAAKATLLFKARPRHPPPSWYLNISLFALN